LESRTQGACAARRMRAELHGQAGVAIGARVYMMRPGRRCRPMLYLSLRLSQTVPMSHVNASGDVYPAYMVESCSCRRVASLVCQGAKARSTARWRHMGHVCKLRKSRARLLRGSYGLMSSACILRNTYQFTLSRGKGSAFVIAEQSKGGAALLAACIRLCALNRKHTQPSDVKCCRSCTARAGVRTSPARPDHSGGT